MKKNFLNITNILLLGILITLSFATVLSANGFRHNTITLRDAMLALQQQQIEYSKLKLEESTLGEYRKVLEVAETELHLQTPEPRQYVRVTP